MKRETGILRRKPKREWHADQAIGPEELKKILTQLEEQGFTVAWVLQSLDGDEAFRYTVIYFEGYRTVPGMEVKINKR